MNKQDEHDWYVEKVHWLVNAGREDLIDEIADEYERRQDARLETPRLRLVS